MEWNENKAIIVSLTSWPKRIGNVKKVLDSLINQDIKANYIELNLSLEEFPNKEDSLPTELNTLINTEKSVEVNWVSGNDGVFKKIIPTLKKFYGKDYYLLSVDDDWVYRKDYIKMMVGYILKYEADSFCLSNSNFIGNRMIYKSTAFDEKFWECLTQEVIDTRIDDSYIEHYFHCKGRKSSSFRPDDVADITVKYNPVFPNSHNEKTGQYSFVEVKRAKEIIKNIKFQ